MSQMWTKGDRGDPEQVVAVSLTAEERQLLAFGLLEWGGPACPTDEMARAIGFDDVTHLLAESNRIASDLRDGRPMSRRDWTRALLSTEVVFASDVIGSGVEWPTTTGLDDVATLRVLRSAQKLLVGVVVRPRK